MLQVDISELDPEVRRELIAGRQFKALQEYEQAQQRQRLIAHQTGEHRSIDGLGRLRMSVDTNAFLYWCMRPDVGIKAWSDPQFLREFERDNPEVRVKCGSTKVMVGWRAPDPKYRKRY